MAEMKDYSAYKTLLRATIAEHEQTIRDFASEIADARNEAAAIEVLRRETVAERDQARATVFRIVVAQQRQGWEDGETEEEVRQCALDHLSNWDMDPHKKEDREACKDLIAKNRQVSLAMMRSNQELCVAAEAECADMEACEAAAYDALSRAGIDNAETLAEGVKILTAERGEARAEYAKRCEEARLAQKDIWRAEERAEKAEVEVERLQKENEQLRSSLPFCSDRDTNKADAALGEVYRHRTGEHSSIGVVEAKRARDALVASYAESNALAEEVERLRGVLHKWGPKIALIEQAKKAEAEVERLRRHYVSRDGYLAMAIEVVAEYLHGDGNSRAARQFIDTARALLADKGQNNET